MGARENIRLSYGNFTFDGEYFYSLLYNSQALQVKTDDGSVAFSYPCDTSIAASVESLEWDGVYFWSIEDTGSGFKIRKWAIDDFICKQLTAFTFTTGGSHQYAADDFAVEHYRLTVGNNSNGSGGYTYGIRDIVISDTSTLAVGDILTFVKANTGAHLRYGTSYVGSGTVQSILSSTTVRLTSTLDTDPYGDGKGFRGPTANTPPDNVYVTKALWVLNDNGYGPDTSTGGLYKINSNNGSNIVQYNGTQYSGVDAATFYTKYTVAGSYPNEYNTTVVSDASNGGVQTYLLIVKGSSLLFYNVSTNIIDRSLALDNVKSNNVDLWTVSDLAIGGFEPDVTLFRLQQGTTYGSPASDEAWTSYSYDRTILRRYVKSISISGDPSVIPADGYSTSKITAVVRDQYNTVVSGKTVNFTDDAGGRVSPVSDTTDSLGRAFTTYTAGSSEDFVKITATVPSGLV